ncbi:NUDIX domain-containing protein [Williamsia sp. MIQD14]|uniref:NUDIX domain-containing protein n=1 Tax=Williamsia sp. MIQD14 TaxID=3425703 RepID=UPI003DA13614
MPTDHGAPDDTAVDIATVASREVYRNAWMSVREDRIRRRDGSPGIYGVVDRPLGAVVIARRTRAGVEQFFLVEQFRYTVSARRWEFPAGTSPDSDDALTVARRELLEETGMVSDELRVLSVIDVAPGFTSQRSAVVLADDPRAGVARPEHEEQDLHGRWWTRDEVEHAIRAGTVVDAQSLAAWACLVVSGR